MLTICAEQIGLTGEDFFTPLTADLLAVDIYFTGRVTDQILGMEFSPLGERYFPLIDGRAPAPATVPATGSAGARLRSTSAPTARTRARRACCSSPTAPSPQEAEAFAKTGSPQANEALAIHVTDVLPFDDIPRHELRR